MAPKKRPVTKSGRPRARKGVKLKPTELGPRELLLAERPPELAALADAVEADGGAVLAAYRRGQALADLDKAIELDPKSADSFHGRGTVHHRMGKYAEAIADYGKAIEIAPKNARLYFDRGVAHVNLGNTEKAKEDLLKTVELDPERSTPIAGCVEVVACQDARADARGDDARPGAPCCMPAIQGWPAQEPPPANRKC